MSLKNPIKVMIVIEKRGNGGTNVGFNAPTYGSRSPCHSRKRVNEAIDHCKAWIKREGDIPVIDNQIEKRTLFDFK
jgi:hypothetical protein